MQLLLVKQRAYLAFVPSDFKRVLENGAESGKIEYVQANLLTAETRDKVFLTPQGKAFDWVVDWTGEREFVLLPLCGRLVLIVFNTQL